MPAARDGPSGMVASVAAKASSMRAFWPGYCRMRISRAAAAAAASADAFGSVGSSGVKRAYRSWTALTESDMDTCNIARLRVQGFPATLTAFITSMAALFQSVTTSARPGVTPEISVRLTIAALSALIDASSHLHWVGSLDLK